MSKLYMNQHQKNNYKSQKKNIVIVDNNEDQKDKGEKKSWFTQLKHKQNSEQKNKKTNEDVAKLSTNWVLWCHSIASNDWSLAGYENLYTITNVSEFWKIFNNVDALGLDCMHLFFMKDGVPPIWEDQKNRDGGICSIKTDMINSKEILEDLCIHMVLDNLLCDGVVPDINGISISPKINAKNSFSIIKIWNSDNKNDVSKNLNNKLLAKYKRLSIQYKINNPEY